MRKQYRMVEKNAGETQFRQVGLFEQATMWLGLLVGLHSSQLPGPTAGPLHGFRCSWAGGAWDSVPANRM